MNLFDYTPKTDDLVITLKVADKELTNEDGTPMTITFYSPYSQEAKDIKHSMVDERIARAEAGGETKLNSAEVEKMNLVGLAKNIKEWNITTDKVKPKLSEKAALEVLTKAFWIKPLYDEAIDKSMVFMKG